MTWFKALLLLCSIFVIGRSPDSYGKTPRMPENYLKVPIVSQATSYSCGASALHSILLYWNVYDGTETNLFKKLHTTRKNGTNPRMIVKVSQQFGLLAEMRERLSIADLRANISAGNTVIIDIQAWPDNRTEEGDPSWENMWEDGHYVVVVGLDDEFIYVMDPSARTGYGYIPLKELIVRWHDYEVENGRTWRNYQLGIIIRGRSHINAGDLIRVE